MILGQVLQAGAGQIPARQAAVKAGIPMTVPSITINKVCLSGLDAIALADQLIRAGEFEIVVAGGMESMTQAPHLLPQAARDTSTAPSRCSTRWRTTGCSARSTSARWASRPSGTTPSWASAARSRTRSPRGRTSAPPKAAKNGLFDDEIVPVESRSARATRSSSPTDEGVRADTTVDLLAKLRPAFAADGTITAGSARRSPTARAAVVVMSRAKAEELGLTWLAEIGAHGVVAGPRREAAVAAGQRHQDGAGQGGHRGRRPRPGRDQRGVRVRRASSR